MSFNNSSKPIRFGIGLIAFSLALLNGCANTPTNKVRIDSMHQSMQIRDDLGMVILKTNHNRNPRQLTFIADYSKLKIKNISTNVTYNLKDTSPDMSLFSLFVGHVPSGEYSIVEIDDFGSTWDDFGTSFGRFSVKAGKVNNLGSVVKLSPYHYKKTEPKTLALDNSPLELDSALKSFPPEVVASAKNNKNTWQPLSDKEIRPSLQSVNKGTSLFLNSPYYAPDGLVLFGEALGRIAIRNPSGNWNVEETGTTNTILSLCVLNDGTKVAGSEQGLVLSKSPNYENWKIVPIPLQDASILYIGEDSKLGVVVVAKDIDEVVVLVTQNINTPSWVELKRIPAYISTNSLQNSKFDVFLTKSKLVIVNKSMPGHVDVSFNILDIASGEWKLIPIDLYTLEFTVMNDETTFSMAGPNISRNFYISKDFGLTWEKRQSPNWANQPVFKNADVGYLIRPENAFFANSEMSQSSLWKTINGGKSWELIGKNPNLADRLFIPNNSEQLLISTSDGQFYLSIDDGKTWHLERSIE